MAMVVLKGFIDIPGESWDVVIAELPTHVRLTLDEEGCQCFEVQPVEDVPFRLSVYEEFASEGAFEKHQQRVKGSNWGRLTEKAERHYEISQR